MDPVITPLIVSAGVTGSIEIAAATATTAAVSISYASVVSAALVTGASIGASYALSAANEKKPKFNGEQVTIKQSVPSRIRGYGTVMLGGATFVLADSYQYLYLGIIHAEGPIDSYRSWWLNDKNTGLVAGGLGGTNTVPPWGTLVTIESHLGATDQTASTMLIAAALGGPGWTSAHRLRGLAYSAVRFSIPSGGAAAAKANFSKFFPNGLPSLRVVARLSTVYDPRDTGQDWDDPATWVWSDNACLCILDYLTSERGFGIPHTRMNLDSFSDFADLCDEAVPLAGGGTEPRYRLGGVYDLTEQPREVLRRMLATCDGEIVPFPDGTIGIRGGQWEAPTVTLDEDAVQGFEYQQANDKLSAFNRLKITFTDPANDYQQVEADAWDDTADQGVQGVLSEDFAVPMVQSASQARRLAKIATHKGNPRHRLTGVVTNMAGLAAYGERTVHITLPIIGIDDDFLVTRFEIAGDFTTCTMDLSSLDSAAYAWNPDDEEGTAPSVGDSVSVDVEAPDPAGIVATRTTTTSITVTATAPSPATGWDLIGQLRASGATDWIPITDGNTLSATTVLASGLTAGTTYEVQVAYFGFGSQSAWSATQTVLP